MNIRPFQIATGFAMALLVTTSCAFAQQAIRYRWEAVYYGSFQGKQALLYSDSAFHGKLAFGDLDGDGDPDLLVGKQDGRISRFENTGRPGAPIWKLIEENIVATLFTRTKGGVKERQRRQIDVGSYAAPALADIDQDGDLDLVVGSAIGKLILFRNVGTDSLMSLELETDAFVPPNFGTRVVPVLADINGDLAYDLLIGNAAGSVFLLPNKGNKKNPVFCAQFPSPRARAGKPPPCRPTPIRITDISPASYAAPALVDWDQDGDKDLFVGKRNGTISYFENNGTDRRPEWRLKQVRFLAIDNGGYAAPAFVELNGDGKPDLVAGTNSNNIFMYTNKDTGQVLDVWKVTSNLLTVQRLGRDQVNIAITSGDLDGDGDLDLVIGDESGNLVLVLNTGTKKSPAWQISRGNLFSGASRRNTAPFLVDADQDGDLDLFVGGADGKIWFVENVGGAKTPQWRLSDTNYAGIDVGSNSVPTLRDMDNDGDLDMIIGNSRGLVIYFKNEGTRKRPDYRLSNTRFASLTVGRDAAPALFDWNDDKLPDLVIGNRTGNLALTENRNKSGAEPNAWKLVSRRWEGFQSKGRSIPHFGDFNGDGEVDLLVGDKEGNLRLWLNGGKQIVGKNGGQAGQKGGKGGGTPVASQGNPLTAVSGDAARTRIANNADLSSLLSGSAEPKGPITPQLVLASRAYAGLKYRGRIVPAFADLDRDGDPDLVVGTNDGKLMYYRNLGPVKNPKWRKTTDSLAGYKHGRNAHPSFADLDGDGTLDLLVGSEDGRVHFFKGEDKSGRLEFRYEKSMLAAVNVGRNAAPTLLVIKERKSPLLLVGNFAGKIMAYEDPKHGSPLNFRRSHRQFLGLDVGVSATPHVFDIDRDGIADLLVGSDQGMILNYTKIPVTSKNSWGWQKGPEYLKSLKFPAGSTPRMTDIDDDGDPDLFLGTEKGVIYFYRNDANTQ